MKHETILKRLNEILQLRDGTVAKRKIRELAQELEAYIKLQQEKKERYGKAIQHLMGWYKSLWNNKPPESFTRTKWEDVVGKTLRELIVIYEQNGLKIEDLKREYEEFKQSNRWLTGDKSISRFRQVLSQLKQEQQKKWTSPETERGLSYYFDENDKPEW